MDFWTLNHEATFKDIKDFNYANQKLAVVIHIQNDEGKILLQQRGEKSNGDRGLYEDIGGKLEEYDATFKDAIKRELEEEVGRDIKLNISDSIGIFRSFKDNVNWIFIVYFGQYLSGEFKIMEKEKCLGYKFFTYEELMNCNLVSDSCKFLTKSIKYYK